MNEEEMKKKELEEKEKADALRQKKIDDARKLILEMKITCAPDMPRPLQPGNVSKGTVDVQTNLFGIRMSEDLPIYKYDVFITSQLGKKIVEFTRKGKSDYMVTDRKKNCMAVFAKAIKETSFYRDDLTFFYDGQSLLYTTEKIAFPDASKPNETVIIEGEKVSNDLEPFKHIYFAIKECAEGLLECRMSDIRKIDRDMTRRDRSAMQFVEVATSMYALSQSDSRFTVFAHGKIFPNRPDIEKIPTVKMKEGKVLIPGMFKSVKLLEGPRGRNNASPALAIDSLKAAFHVKEKVIDKAMGVFMDINKAHHHEIESFASMVRGLGCITTHLKKPRRIEIHGVSKDNAISKKLEILLDGGLSRTMNVAEYFKHKYLLDLKFPLAPLIMCKEKGQANLYPMELLDIIPMQRVTIPQTTSSQSQVATKECAVPPGARQNAILQQCRLHDLFNPEHPFLKAAGLGIIEAPLQVTARVLKGPVLQYKTNEIEVHGAWRPPSSFQFANPATCPRWVMCAMLGPRDSFGVPDMKMFAAAFVKRCRERGMTMPDPAEFHILGPPPQDKSSDFPAREMIKEASYHGSTFIMFVTNEFISVHKHIKLQERYSNVATQDLKLKTVQNYLSKGQQLTMDNIVYKTNLKLGGLNYSVSLKNVIGPSYDPFPPNRLIMGIGVAHAPVVQFIHSEGPDKPPIAPAVVGYSANMAGKNSFVGDFLLQETRTVDVLLCTTEMLQNVIDRFVGGVDDDGNRTGEKKNSIKSMIVYRQGVSEGFYAMCIREEIPLMKAVLAKNGFTDVKVTYIIVQKEHGIRLMPVDINTTEKATAQNIGTGVVIDSQITNPRLREWICNSHVTLQGTARTPRYTVLHDDANLAMNELESVTHALAFNFQIVNSPVSIPAPLYIANRYAQRGVDLYTSKATDEMATSEQKIRNSMANMNVDLTYALSKLGKARINA